MFILLPQISCRLPSDPIVMAVRNLTAAPARIVWCQDIGASLHTRGTSGTLRLMGWDSEDGLGERVILSGPSQYAKPIFTRDGRRVVFSDLGDDNVWLVNWNGTGLKKITRGFALAVWQDPKTGNNWVYVGDSVPPALTVLSSVRNLRRHLLEQPEINEPVWNRTQLDSDNFQLSADGNCASAVCPWPQCGVIELPNGEIKKYGTGCWPSLAPDDSRLFWFFDGAHRNLTICDTIASQSWMVPIDQAPGIEGYEVYHPRWSSHPRFMVMTGPYKIGSDENRIDGGGPEVEIYLSRFSPDFKTIEQTVRVTSNTNADYFPDAWIAYKHKPTNFIPIHAAVKPALESWPGKQDNLVFLWENRAANNEVRATESGIRKIYRIEPRGTACYGRFLEMDTSGGSFVAEDAGEALFAACSKTYQLGVEIVLTPRHIPQTGPARIIAYSSGTNAFNFLLGQDGNKLVLRLRSAKHALTDDEPWLDLCELKPGKPHHIIISLRPGKLACFLNGERIFFSDSVTVGNWAIRPLVFGDELSGGANWSGKLEGAAFYSRWIDAEEARRKYHLYLPRLQARKDAPRLVVEARVIEKTRIPAPMAIAPYRRALAVNSYAVKKVFSGTYTNSEIMVAHWVIMNAEVLADAGRVVNRAYRMTLEQFDAHPELEGERLVMNSENYDLPLYYELR